MWIQVCAICGVLCISLPIPIIVNNFNNIYEKSKIEEEIKAKKTKSSWEDANRGRHCHHCHCIWNWRTLYSCVSVSWFCVQSNIVGKGQEPNSHGEESIDGHGLAPSCRVAQLLPRTHAVARNQQNLWEPRGQPGCLTVLLNLSYQIWSHEGFTFKKSATFWPKFPSSGNRPIWPEFLPELITDL